MCDAATQTLIDGVISDLTSGNIMFTAMDAVRKLWVAMGNNEDDQWPRGFYNDHKGDIHRGMSPLVQNCIYARELRNVGAPTSAYVYYPIGSDPAQYTPIARHDAAPAVAPSGVASMAVQAATVPANIAVQTPTAPATPKADTGDASNGWQRGLTGYNRLCVPNALMRAAGFSVGEEAYLEADGGEVRLTKNSPTTVTASQVATYIVDEDCNARVVGSALAKAGLDTGKQFKFTGDATKVVIQNV